MRRDARTMLIRVVAAFLIASFMAIPSVAVHAARVQAFVASRAHVSPAPAHVERARSIVVAPRDAHVPFAIGPALPVEAAAFVPAACFVRVELALHSVDCNATLETTEARARAPPSFA